MCKSTELFEYCTFIVLHCKSTELFEYRTIIVLHCKSTELFEHCTIIVLYFVALQYRKTTLDCTVSWYQDISDVVLISVNTWTVFPVGLCSCRLDQLEPMADY